MNTRVIHYCWFGGKKLPKKFKKYIASWKKYCPDYKIIEWNESNFDMNCCEYVKQAVEAKKWAFVSDYCRFHILNEQGGVYLDTDVELIKGLDDLPDSFVGFESKETVASGLIRGACKDDEICRLMLESYHNDKFIKDDGQLNLMTVCVRETEILKKFGLVPDGSLQTVCDTTVYPTEYFCPIDVSTNELHITDKTYSIHHYAGSWLSKKDKFKMLVRKIIGNKLYMKLYNIKHKKK